MQDLTPGHLLLKSRHFKEADEYFSKMANFFKNDPRTVNGCLYGQARALIGMRNLPSATTLLLCLIQNVPNWEAPYITLARVYESQSVTRQMLGLTKEAKEMFKKAEQTFLDAINNTGRSKRLTDSYEYFLREHVAQFASQPKAQSFTPGFTASMRTRSTVAIQTNSTSLGSLEFNLSKLSIKTP